MLLASYLFMLYPAAFSPFLPVTVLNNFVNNILHWEDTQTLYFPPWVVAAHDFKMSTAVLHPFGILFLNKVPWAGFAVCVCTRKKKDKFFYSHVFRSSLSVVWLLTIALIIIFQSTLRLSLSSSSITPCKSSKDIQCK